MCQWSYICTICTTNPPLCYEDPMQFKRISGVDFVPWITAKNKLLKTKIAKVCLGNWSFQRKYENCFKKNAPALNLYQQVNDSIFNWWPCYRWIFKFIADKTAWHDHNKLTTACLSTTNSTTAGVRHAMMTSSNGNIFRVTGPLCGEFTGPGEFPTQRPVTRSFDVFFDLRLNKRLSKQSWGWWPETPSSSLWRHRNGIRQIVNGWRLFCYTSHRVFDWELSCTWASIH